MIIDTLKLYLQLEQLAFDADYLLQAIDHQNQEFKK